VTALGVLTRAGVEAGPGQRTAGIGAVRRLEEAGRLEAAPPAGPSPNLAEPLSRDCRYIVASERLVPAVRRRPAANQKRERMTAAILVGPSPQLLRTQLWGIERKLPQEAERLCGEHSLLSMIDDRT
jgi:hypothetical protein